LNICLGAPESLVTPLIRNYLKYKLIKENTILEIHGAPMKKQSSRKTSVHQQQRSETEPYFRILYMSARKTNPANLVNTYIMAQ